MRRNVSGQFVGAQLIAKADGTPITTGTTTVYVTGNAGTQAAGSVGSGACTHEGNGFWTYAPAQAETNYTHVAFTFVNSNAINVTVQIYPTAYDASGQMTGVSLAADQAVNTTKIGGTTQTARDIGASVLLSSGTGTGQVKLSAGYVAPNWGDVGNPTTTVGLTNTTVGIVTTLTNLPAITAGWLTAAGIAAGALNGKGDWNIGKTGYALSAAGIQGIWDALTSALTTVGSIGKKLADWVIGTTQTGDAYARLGAPAGASVSADIAAVKADTAAVKAKTDNLPASPAAVGSAMTLTAAYDAAKTAASQTSVDDLPTNAELATSQAAADDATLAQIALVKAKTDQLIFTKANELDVNQKSINGTTVNGNGSSTPWGP